MNGKRQKEGKFGYAVYKFTFTVCRRGDSTCVIVVLGTRVSSVHVRCCASGFCIIGKFCVRVFRW